MIFYERPFGFLLMVVNERELPDPSCRGAR
jgi:hypothetical protein